MKVLWAALVVTLLAGMWAGLAPVPALAPPMHTCTPISSLGPSSCCYVVVEGRPRCEASRPLALSGFFYSLWASVSPPLKTVLMHCSRADTELQIGVRCD